MSLSLSLSLELAAAKHDKVGWFDSSHVNPQPDWLIVPQWNASQKSSMKPAWMLQGGSPSPSLIAMYPLVNVNIAIENGPFSSLIYLSKIVIFHSYVQ